MDFQAPSPFQIPEFPELTESERRLLAELPQTEYWEAISKLWMWLLNSYTVYLYRAKDDPNFIRGIIHGIGLAKDIADNHEKYAKPIHTQEEQKIRDKTAEFFSDR